MDFVGEAVEDWWDLVQQIRKRTVGEIECDAPIIAAVVLLARELRDYRRWAEQYHLT